MKKIIVFLIIITFSLFNVNADDSNTGFLFKDRTIEFGFNLSAGFSNNFFKAGEVLKENVYLDLDAMGELNINAGAAVTPFYFSFNRNDNWGFGFSVNLEAFGFIGLSQNLLSFNEVVNDKSDTGFSVFSDAAFDVFFNIQDFKIKVRPSVFFPIAYSKSDLLYTFSTTDTPVISIDYNALIYTAFRIDDVDNVQFEFDLLSATPGIDVSIGIEYPLSEKFGIDKNFALFDFDVGLDLQNIPLKASTMRHYIQIIGNATLKGDTIDEFFNSFDEDEFFSDPEYGEEKITIERPFRTILYANWRPLTSKIFTIIPQLGFSINPIYLDPFSMEGGLKLKIDINNIFAIQTGTRYEERFWKSGLDMAVNLRFYELNIGIYFNSPEFKKIFNPAGAGLSVGFKFGF